MKEQKEIWKPIPSLEGYEASTHGRIRSLDRVTVTKKGSKEYTARRTGRVLKQCKTSRGGRYLAICVKGHKYVHRLVLETFVPNTENKSQVNHKDGNGHNNHIDNLEWNTPSENVRHAYDNNLMTSAFTPKLKKYAVEQSKNGVSIASLSRQINVTTRTISRYLKSVSACNDKVETYKRKLDRETADEIRKAYASGLTQRDAAKAFGCSLTTVSFIVNNKIWC